MSRKLAAMLGLIFLLGANGLQFKVCKAEVDLTVRIRADGSVYPSTAPISTFDNITYALTANITCDADGIVVERSNIIVDGNGYTVQGTGAWLSRGILVNMSNVTITGTNIKGFYYGVYLDSASQNVISRNNIAANAYDGIILYYSSSNVISGNNIADNNSSGIILAVSSNNILTGNNISKNNYRGIMVGSHSSHNIVSGNNVRNNSNGIMLYSSPSNVISGNNITDNIYDGIKLYYSLDYNSVTGNNIVNNFHGIYLGSSSNTSIIGNNVLNNFQGIHIDGSSNDTMSGNLLVNNARNFFIIGHELPEFMHSIDTSNRLNGKPIYYMINQTDLVINPATYPEVGYLALINCANITVEGLDLTNNGQGLLLAQTHDSRVTRNNLTDNSYGIWFQSCLNNILSSNGIVNNEFGIYIELSADNSIYDNNLVNNTNRVWDYSWDNKFVPQSINVWSSDLEGNYWSDYAGSDLDYDGIGDTSYAIYENNTDGYPLLAPCRTFNAGTWGGITHFVSVVSNSNISDFAFRLTDQSHAALAFNVTGETGTEGFCRISVSKSLINSSYVARLNGQVITYPQMRELPCSNETYEYLYINYSQSEHSIEIEGTTMIPEFPSFIIIPLFIITTLVVMVYGRKRAIQPDQ